MSRGARIATYTLSGLLLSLTAALILEGAFDLPLIFAWLIAINVFTFLFYAIDKLNSKAGIQGAKIRIPEWALLLLALAGGSPLAALAILLLPHKIRQFWFMLGYIVILLLQAAVVYIYHDRLPLPGFLS